MMHYKAITCFFLLLVPITSSQAQVDLPNGLLACYPFTGNANDASGNSNNGIVHGATLTTDRFGNANSAYRFNGSGEYISIAPEQLEINQFSYSLWVNAHSVPAAGTSYFIFSVGSEYGDQSVGLNQVYSGPNNGWTGGGYSAVGENQFYATGVLPPTNAWTHLVVTCDNSLLKLYVDGQLAGSVSVAGKTPFYGTGTVAATIGGRSTLIQYFDGDIDDLRLYNRALSAAEVTELYTNAPPCEPAPDLTKGILACFPFTGNANDASGNNNNGTVSGAALTTDRFGNANSAYNFDGVNDYIEIPSDKFKNNNYTFSLWMKVIAHPVKGNDYKIFSIGSANGSQNIALSNFYLDKYFGWVATSYNVDPPGTSIDCANTYLPGLHTWYHIVSARDNSTLKLYINGELVQSSATNGVMPFYGEDVKAIIGTGSIPTQYTTNEIDDIRIYDRALSVVEVTELYNAPDLQALSVQASNLTPCTGREVTFSATPAPGGDTQYQWKVDGVNQGGLSNSPSFAFTFANNSSSYAATVSVEATSKASCISAVGQTTVNVKPKTIPSITVQADNATPCVETPVKFTASSNVANVLYQWKIDGVNQGAPTSSTTFSTNFADAGQSYNSTISVEVTSSDPCTFPAKATAQTDVKVNTRTVPVVSIQASEPFTCPNLPATFTATPYIPGATYQWKVDGVAQGQPGTSASFSHTFPDKASAYTAKLEVEVSIGDKCTLPVSAQLTVNVTPPLSILIMLTVNSQVTCADKAVTFSVSPTIVGSLYQWKLNGANQGNWTDSPIFVYSFPDENQFYEAIVSVEVLAKLPCTAVASAQIKIKVLPNPKLICSFSSTAEKGTLTRYAVTTTQGRPPYTYSWKFGSDERISLSDTLSYAFADTGRYEIEVIATDQSGCKAVCQTNQQVIRTLFFPNVFTPNGDTHNDTFTIQYEGKDFEMSIYNRWGELVAKTTDGLYGWDGEGYPTGLYYYQITFASKEYKGWLSLLR